MFKKNIFLNSDFFMKAYFWVFLLIFTARIWMRRPGAGLLKLILCLGTKCLSRNVPAKMREIRAFLKISEISLLVPTLLKGLTLAQR